MSLRAGMASASLGGLIHSVLESERCLREYVVPYTNAPALIQEGLHGLEDLKGLFRG